MQTKNQQLDMQTEANYPLKNHTINLLIQLNKNRCKSHIMSEVFPN